MQEEMEYGTVVYVPKAQYEAKKNELLVELASLRAERDRLKLAYGLVLQVHGCGGDNCTEVSFLKDAEEMIVLAGQAKIVEAERDHLREALTQIKQRFDVADDGTLLVHPGVAWAMWREARAALAPPVQETPK
jgi:hypothetical protein